MLPLFALVVFSSTGSVSAAGESISNFHSHINVEASGEVRVVEEIDYDFGSLQKHGIFREIPYVYLDKNGKNLYTEVKFQSVVRNGFKENYTTSFDSSFVRIKIGDPNKTIGGRQSYRLEYLASGILSSYESYDELYWNMTGGRWQVPIQAASATVSLPSDGIVQTSCYQGPSSSTESCDSKKDSGMQASFASSRALGSSEGLTVAVGYTKGLVPILSAAAPKSIGEEIFNPINSGVLVLVFLMGTAVVFWLWWKGGRDLWWRSRFPADPQARLEVKPVGAHETIVVEYESPERLRPAEIGALLDEKAKTLDVTATLVDLANRGFLLITEEPKKWVFGSTDYVLSKKAADETGLLKYEKELLDRLFDEGDIVSMSALKMKFYKDLSVVKDKLNEDLVDKKFFLEKPDSVRTKYSVAAIVVGVISGGLIWAGFVLHLAILASAGLGLVGAALLLLIAARFMPARTALGRRMYLRAKGYKLFVETAEKYRQQFFERKNLFNEVLPYAIVFGVTEKFARSFADMGLAPSQPSWYSGTGTFNAAVFGASMASFSNSFSSAMAASPSSSGSGGGGFSGGGFGGGGGGSW
ncbi:MAG: hypothetical protein A3F35_03455 [Candidatus Woykebacteria bacterium RIFCSPHIGHO2_12_FULL_45_10]|uniref:DUF2207 domain-containing protein n=1 Tax=Candidatus Woykebacteria bacterium RIFCSPHIGHO2_12_FULL_45_10 TaxID=1802603 RepID=A0A1G1WRS3_9BACT|nr:MAG: hypothetical protein A3F35_03455 [Candidatus Woykebacteria bacterium RIFCSPHIGHO2_12_FULL_45_10]